VQESPPQDFANHMMCPDKMSAFENAFDNAMEKSSECLNAFVVNISGYLITIEAG